MLPLLAASAACAAPPLGIGTGAHHPTTTGGERVRFGAYGAGATSVAVADHRRAFQAEGGGGLIIRRWFAVEGGIVYSQLSDDRDGTVFAAGAFPYLRPRFFIGNVSIATALAGLGFGGGGGGIAGGIADVQVGYGTATWSAYAGGYGVAFEVTSEDGIKNVGSQLRVGGEYLFPMGAVKLGVALELYRQHDELTGDGRTVESRFTGAGVKLRIESAVFE